MLVRQGSSGEYGPVDFYCGPIQVVQLNWE